MNDYDEYSKIALLALSHPIIWIDYFSITTKKRVSKLSL